MSVGCARLNLCGSIGQHTFIGKFACFAAGFLLFTEPNPQCSWHVLEQLLNQELLGDSFNSGTICCPLVKEISHPSRDFNVWLSILPSCRSEALAISLSLSCSAT